MSDFGRLVRHFKKAYPEIQVSVSRKSPPGCWAHCVPTRAGNVFEIRIDGKLCEAAQVLLLIHEWAHALTYYVDKDISDHGPMFGVAYAECWRKYLEWVHSE